MTLPLRPCYFLYWGVKINNLYINSRMQFFCYIYEYKYIWTNNKNRYNKHNTNVIKHLNTIEVSKGRKCSSDGGCIFHLYSHWKALEQVCIASCAVSPVVTVTLCPALWGRSGKEGQVLLMVLQQQVWKPNLAVLLNMSIWSFFWILCPTGNSTCCHSGLCQVRGGIGIRTCGIPYQRVSTLPWDHCDAIRTFAIRAV